MRDNKFLHYLGEYSFIKIFYLMKSIWFHWILLVREKNRILDEQYSSLHQIVFTLVDLLGLNGYSRISLNETQNNPHYHQLTKMQKKTEFDGSEPFPIRMRMSLRIKPREVKDGVLVYCAQTEDGQGDFTSLAIKGKRIEFRFDSGSGNGKKRIAALQMDAITFAWIRFRTGHSEERQGDPRRWVGTDHGGSELPRWPVDYRQRRHWSSR